MRRLKRLMVIGGLLAATGAGAVSAHAAPEPTALGSVRLPRAVLADGKPLLAGAYQLRATDDFAKPAAGQSADGERWLEFLKGGRVVGRELATVVSASDIAAIAKGPRPGPNRSRVDLLKGGNYLRVWINRDGTNYLVNLPTCS